MANWKTWANFDDGGEPDGATIIGTEAGEALFCTVAATPADVAVAAAAPELLEALEKLAALDAPCPFPPNDPRDPMWFRLLGGDGVIRAAIAKAKGVTHA